MIWKRIKRAYKAFSEPEGFVWTGFVKPQNEPENTVYHNPFSGKAQIISYKKVDPVKQIIGNETAI